MKSRIKSLLIILTAILAAVIAMTAMFAGCSSPTADPNTAENETADTAADLETGEIVFAERDADSPFKLVYSVDTTDDSQRDEILKIRSTLRDRLNCSISPVDDYFPKDETAFEIIVNSVTRPECAGLKESLGENEYIIKTTVTDEKTSIIIAYKGGYACMCAIKKFSDSFIGDEKGAIPAGTEIREKVKPLLIESGIERLRDPCVIYHEGVYYVYGTGWVCYKNTSGSLDGGWTGPYEVAVAPENCVDNKWAPEVHFYKGSFYMFTTYKSSKNGHRGCTIMKSKSPMGPFVEISDGHLTPDDWDAIDGTFYVDPDGQPWMIFVHEWTCTPDGVGRMACAQLSDDLTHFISEPVEMFRADDPKWAKGKVTDGCWMYTTEKGSLLMIWSNWDAYGYCVGIARSESGLVIGPWVQEEKLLYSKSMTNQYDGGHGMLFTHTDGQLYLSLHSPNDSAAGRREMPVFIPVREENDTLVWDK